MADVVVADSPALSRVEVFVGGGLAGFSAYVVAGGVRVFTHAEVDAAFGGQGVGSALARGALDLARADGVLVDPQCPFIRGWIDKHPDYADLVAD
jgi:predicted GNAT family acetyltransferase